MSPTDLNRKVLIGSLQTHTVPTNTSLPPLPPLLKKFPNSPTPIPTLYRSSKPNSSTTHPEPVPS
jgi:hypothetical protein